MEVQFWAATDVGRVREQNEDNFLVDKRLNLFVVCDGMGGHSAGEVASAVAVRAIREVVANNRDILERCDKDCDDIQLRKEVLRLLEYAIQEACTRVFDMAQKNPDRRGMGTTCSMLAVIGRRCFIGHVGDSRIYLYRKGQVHQLTEDHTLLNEMMRRKRIKDPSKVSNKYKNAITRAVGVYETVEVDTMDFDTLAGDRFLLCSDGLSGYTEDITILTPFLKPDHPKKPPTQDELKRITRDLVDFANAEGGKDNITAVLVALSEDVDEIETEEVRLTMDAIRDIPLFHYLNYKDLGRVVSGIQKVHVRKGDWIIREEEEGEELFIIMSGRFLVERGGREIARLGKGRHFGEMALIDDEPRSASVRCLTDGVLLSLGRRAFYDLLRDDQALAVKLLWNFIQTLSGHLRKASAMDLRERFHDSQTMSATLPPALMTQEIEALEHSGAHTLTEEEEDDDALLSEIERMETISGEDITLPGLRVEDAEVDTEPSPTRGRPRFDASRRGSALNVMSGKLSPTDPQDQKGSFDDDY